MGKSSFYSQSGASATSLIEFLEYSTAAAASAAAALASETAAAASAAAALVSENAAAADLALTNADVVLTNADVVLTGLDVVSTNADVVATNADVVLTNADVVLTGLDAAATAADVTAAAASEAAAAASFDAFDDIYLGAKAAEPTLDNDGAALATGALYFNTVTDDFWVYNGATWQVTAITTAGLLSAANNLSDVANAVTAAQNLNLEPGVDVQQWDAKLDAISGLAVTDGNIIVGNGAAFVAESGATARTSLGVTIGTNVQAWAAILDATTASYTSAEETKLAGIATGANLYSHPNHSGDVTSVADGAQTIAAGAVTLAKMANMATASLLGRNTAGTGVPEVLSATTARSLLGLVIGTDVLAPNGSGASLTALNATQLTTGAVPSARLTSVPAASFTGTIDEARFAAGGNADGTRTVSTSAASGGSNGDIWYKY